MTCSLCVIGAGRIGRIHASNINRHRSAHVRYVVDVEPEAATSLAAECGAEVVDVDAALGDPSIDGVVIASSTDTHLPLIEACASSGKAVFCEKPLDLDTSRAIRCGEIAADSNIALYIGFNRRYDPSFRRIRDDAASGALGRLEMVSITSRDPAPPPVDYLRRSGGLFRDMMIHDFDLLRWLTDAEPVNVYATGSAMVSQDVAQIGDIDTAAVIVEMDNGCFGQITNSRRCVYGYDQRIEAFGADGMLRAGNVTATQVEHATATGFQTEPALPFFLERYEAAYWLEMNDFIAALQGGEHALATARDGIRALEMADAAEESCTSGRSVDVSS